MWQFMRLTCTLIRLEQSKLHAKIKAKAKSQLYLLTSFEMRMRMKCE